MREISKAPVRSPKEALEWLDEHCIGDIVPLWVKMSASNALEKQIPKKPIPQLIKSNPRCSECGRVISAVEYARKIDYCCDCGQAIDWSEYEE